MTPERLIVDLDELLKRLQVRYAIVGSVASISYGEPRLTNDVDIVAELKPEHVEAFVAAFPGPDFDLSAPAMRSAIQQRFQFNIIHNTEGVKADIILAHDNDLHRALLARRVRLEIGENAFAWIASPEDVILGKLQCHRLGNSPKHIRDIVGMMRVTDSIDREYIENWVDKLSLWESWNEVLKTLKRDAP